MAARMTLYLNDESEAKLAALFAWAKNNPTDWSAMTDTAAPGNVNQLFARLLQLMYERMLRDSKASALAETTPNWTVSAYPLPDDDAPPVDLEHYRFLLKHEAQRRGVTIAALLTEWQQQRANATVLPELDEDPLWEMVGIAHGGRDNVSTEHDLYLAEARAARMSPAP